MPARKRAILSQPARMARSRKPPLRHTALALSGGGSEGDFQVGAIQYLYERMMIQPGIICGTSVGSVNGFGLATEGGLDQLVTFWEELQVNSDMYTPEWWSEKLRDLPGFLSSVNQVPGILGDVFVPGMLITSILAAIKLAADVADLKDTMKMAFSSKSLFNLTPIRTKLESADDGNAAANVANSGIILRLACVGLESGRVRFVTEEGKFLDASGDEESVPLIDAVLASSAIPAIFSAIRLNDQWYVDGGIRLVIPVQAAIDSGADEIYAIEVSKDDIDPAESFHDKSFVDIAQRSVMQIMTNAMIQKDLYPPGGWGPKVTIIQPTFQVHDPMTVDPGLISISIAYGFMRAYDATAKFASGGTPTPYGQPTGARLKAFGSSDQIARLRSTIWGLEHDANLKPYRNFLSDPAAVSWDGLRTDLFARGSDNALWHKWYDYDQSHWSWWESLEGNLSSGPAVASWAPGRLDVFARGMDNSLWHRAYDGGTWSQWDNVLGGKLASAPAVASWGPGRLDVFAKGLDDAIWHRAFQDGNWTDWDDIVGGRSVFGPAVSSWGPNHLDVFIISGVPLDAWANAMYHRAFDNGAWSDWELLGGEFSSSPAAVSSKPGRLDVFGRGADPSLYHRWFDGNGWAVAKDIPGNKWGNDWEGLGGELVSGPAASLRLTSRATTERQPEVWATGPDDEVPTDPVNELFPSYNRMNHRWYSPGGLGFVGGWSKWETLGSLAPDPNWAWLQLRQLKRELKTLVDFRLQRGWAVPDNVQEWWAQWERHNWVALKRGGPFTQTPWGALTNYQVGIDIPGDSP